MKAQRTELNLWQELKVALTSPQSADLPHLCTLLDWAIAQLPESQQLDIASKAIEQMVNLYALRFQVLMSVWEETDDSLDTALPVLDLEALEPWVRQSMSVDLDAFVEQHQSKRQRKPQHRHPEDSIVAIVEGEAVSEIADWIEAEQNPVDLVQQLAGEEDPAKWSEAISSWIRGSVLPQPIRLTELLHELPMPWIEIWLGLLLGRFELEQRGEFYTDEIFIRTCPETK